MCQFETPIIALSFFMKMSPGKSCRACLSLREIASFEPLLAQHLLSRASPECTRYIALDCSPQTLTPIGHVSMGSGNCEVYSLLRYRRSLFLENGLATGRVKVEVRPVPPAPELSARHQGQSAAEGAWWTWLASHSSAPTEPPPHSEALPVRLLCMHRVHRLEEFVRKGEGASRKGRDCCRTGRPRG
jgi:hypothetical protein